MGLSQLQLEENIPFQVGQWMEEYISGAARGPLYCHVKEAHLPRENEAEMQKAAEKKGGGVLAASNSPSLCKLCLCLLTPGS